MPQAKNITIYTIGHSNHPAEHFIELLKEHKIELVIDVRSSPHSRYCPQFNKNALAQTLQLAGIEYKFLGSELGGRPDDSALFTDNKVDFALLAQQPAFLAAIEDVIKLSAEKKVALMCSEKDPLKCHRTILISRHLKNEDVNVLHILSDASLISQADIEQSLIELHKLNDMYNSRDDILNLAYDLQTKRIS
ncbi:MAG: DUF488 domain-containing protein [Phycisphaerae bacterium]